MGVGREKTAFARRREILAESLSSSQNITNILPSINPTRRFSLCNTPPPPLFIHLYGNLDKTSLSFSLFLFLCSRVSAHKVSSHVKFTTTAYRPCAWNERTFLDVAWRLRSRSCLVRVENYRDSIVEQVRTSTLDDIFSLSLSVAGSPRFSDLSRTLPLEE